MFPLLYNLESLNQQHIILNQRTFALITSQKLSMFILYFTYKALLQLFYYRCLSILMNKLLCSTIWFVVLKTVRKMANFTAIIVTVHCVNNAETNIKNVPKPKTMKLSFTETANISFPWKYAKTIQHEIKNCFVENVAFPYALNAP